MLDLCVQIFRKTAKYVAALASAALLIGCAAPPAPAPAVGEALGLNAEYFSSTSFSGPKVRQADSQMAFNWGRLPASRAVIPDHFSARWSGTLTAPTTGTYSISIEGEGDVSVHLGDRSTMHAGETVSMMLTAGQPIPLRAEFRQTTLFPRFVLKWSSVEARIPVQIVPVSAFHRQQATSNAAANVTSQNVSTGGVPRGQNLLTNGNFEGGTAGWSGTFDIVTSTDYGLNASAKLTNFGYLQQNLPGQYTEVGATYTLSASAKSSSSDSCTVGLAYFNSMGNVTKREIPFNGLWDGDWKTANTSVLLPYDTVFVAVYLGSNAADCTFDNLDLSVGSQQATTVATNWVQNGDFESNASDQAVSDWSGSGYLIVPGYSQSAAPSHGFSNAHYGYAQQDLPASTAAGTVAGQKYTLSAVARAVGGGTCTVGVRGGNDNDVLFSSYLDFRVGGWTSHNVEGTFPAGVKWISVFTATTDPECQFDDLQFGSSTNTISSDDDAASDYRRVIDTDYTDQGQLSTISNPQLFRTIFRLSFPADEKDTYTDADIEKIRQSFLNPPQNSGLSSQATDYTPCTQKYLTQRGLIEKGPYAQPIYIDNLGRPKSTTVQIPPFPPKMNEGKRDRDCSKEIGKFEYDSGWDGGHLFGFESGGYDGRENIVPQALGFNRGTWRELEKALRKCSNLSSRSTLFSVELEYGDSSHPLTPTKFRVHVQGTSFFPRTGAVISIIDAKYTFLNSDDSVAYTKNRKELINFRQDLADLGCIPAVLEISPTPPTKRINIQIRAASSGFDESRFTVKNSGEDGSSLLYDTIGFSKNTNILNIDKTNLSIFSSARSRSVGSLGLTQPLKVIGSFEEDTWEYGQLSLSNGNGGILTKVEDQEAPEETHTVRMTCNHPEAQHLAYILIPSYTGERRTSGEPIITQDNIMVDARCTGPLLKLKSGEDITWNLKDGETASQMFNFANNGVTGVKYPDLATLDWRASLNGGNLFSVDKTAGSVEVDHEDAFNVTAKCPANPDPDSTHTSTTAVHLTSNDVTHAEQVWTIRVNCGGKPPVISNFDHLVYLPIAPGNTISDVVRFGNCLVENISAESLKKTKIGRQDEQEKCRDLHFTVATPPDVTAKSDVSVIPSGQTAELTISATCHDMGLHEYIIKIHSSDEMVEDVSRLISVNCLSPMPSLSFVSGNGGSLYNENTKSYEYSEASAMIDFSTDVKFKILNNSSMDSKGGFTPLIYNLNGQQFNLSRSNGSLAPGVSDMLTGTISCTPEMEGKNIYTISGQSNSIANSGKFDTSIYVICSPRQHVSPPPLSVALFRPTHPSNEIGGTAKYTINLSNLSSVSMKSILPSVGVHFYMTDSRLSVVDVSQDQPQGSEVIPFGKTSSFQFLGRCIDNSNFSTTVNIVTSDPDYPTTVVPVSINCN